METKDYVLGIVRDQGPELVLKLAPGTQMSLAHLIQWNGKEATFCLNHIRVLHIVPALVVLLTVCCIINMYFLFYFHLIGDCDRYWSLNPPVEGCVRNRILQLHQQFNESTRIALKNCVWPCVEFGQSVYDLHAQAYADCHCSGKIAPLYTWQGIFVGNILPCNSPKAEQSLVPPLCILDAILAYGRCGCGW